MTRFGIRAAGLAAAATLFGAGPARAEPAETSCTICHADPDFFEEEEVAIVTNWRSGVHASFDLSCHDCHGGNPDPEVADDMDAAMDPGDPANPFRGVPAKRDVPSFCGRCHSNPEFMKRYRPDARVDQELEYATSHHGEALVKGNRRVATCVDCHGVHGIQRADDPRSPVYPTQVAKTCGHCHSDPEWMSEAKLPDGRPLPVDQQARWSASVHGRALMERGDLFAPTCNDCHGNHGAVPPGVESVTFVCGRCHGREAELLRGSRKHAGFVEHNEFFEDESVRGCADCHEAPEAAAAITGLRELGQCTACHGNHSVGRPTTALLSHLPETPCALCHGDRGGTPGVIPEPADDRARFERRRDALLAEADRLGLQDEERYDWLVDRLLELPFHTQTVEDQGEEHVVMRPEFGRLFEKFRVGKTRYTFTDPATGEVRTDRVRRCSDCHGAGPETVDESEGLRVAALFVRRMQDLETLIARAERILLTAKRGGVEVDEARAALDQAVDSQIELQVMVHAFDPDEGSSFATVHTEGIEHATAALAAGHEAVEDLGNRRRGLALSLVLIVLVLIGLALRIRDQSRSAAAESAGGPRS